MTKVTYAGYQDATDGVIKHMEAISLLIVGIPILLLAVSIRYAGRHEVSPESEVHKRFAAALWLGRG